MDFGDVIVHALAVCMYLVIMWVWSCFDDMNWLVVVLSISLYLISCAVWMCCSDWQRMKQTVEDNTIAINALNYEIQCIDNRAQRSYSTFTSNHNSPFSPANHVSCV